MSPLVYCVMTVREPRLGFVTLFTWSIKLLTNVGAEFLLRGIRVTRRCSTTSVIKARSTIATAFSLATNLGGLREISHRCGTWKSAVVSNVVAAATRYMASEIGHRTAVSNATLQLLHDLLQRNSATDSGFAAVSQSLRM